MYLVELGPSSGRPAKPEIETVVVKPLLSEQRYRPVRSIEEIEADANQSDQSGLDVVIGNYRKEKESAFNFSLVLEVVAYAYQRVRSYFR